jgi:hypothetical protein
MGVGEQLTHSIAGLLLFFLGTVGLASSILLWRARNRQTSIDDPAVLRPTGPIMDRDGSVHTGCTLTEDAMRPEKGD